MIASLWEICAGLWTDIGDFAARRARGCLRRMRLARGEPPTP